MNWSMLTLYPGLVALSAGSCSLAADAIALLVTWYKTFSIVREAKRARIHVPLSRLLLRDGMLIVLFSVLYSHKIT